MQIGLILLALGFPLLELAVLIKMGQWIGVWRTMLLLIVMAAVGGWLVHRQGLAAARRGFEAMQEGRPPLEPVIDSMMLMLAGTLLLIPGLITDVAGLALLIRPVRLAVARWGLGRMLAGADVRVETREWRSPGEGQARRGQDGGPVIDGEWKRVEEPKPRLGDGDGKGEGRRP
jgi:UPF0716 protein FxsA